MPKLSSEKFNELVASFAALPTIGKKTAIRLAYFIAMQSPLAGAKLAADIENAIRFIKPCVRCGNLSENELCEICASDERDKSLLCVVESPKDILTIEESGSFNGLYFVLDRLEDERIAALRTMCVEFGVRELIFALTNAMSADSVGFFVEEQLKDLGLNLSKIAQGVPSGVALDNVDFISLHKALAYRTKI